MLNERHLDKTDCNHGKLTKSRPVRRKMGQEMKRSSDVIVFRELLGLGVELIFGTSVVLRALSLEMFRVLTACCPLSTAP